MPSAGSVLGAALSIGPIRCSLGCSMSAGGWRRLDRVDAGLGRQGFGFNDRLLRPMAACARYRPTLHRCIE
jgi:hypothetical protein